MEIPKYSFLFHRRNFLQLHSGATSLTSGVGGYCKKVNVFVNIPRKSSTLSQALCDSSSRSMHAEQDLSTALSGGDPELENDFLSKLIQKKQFHTAMLCIAKMLRALLSVLPRSSCVSWSPQAKSPIPRMLASR